MKTKDFLLSNIFKILIASIFLAGLAIQIVKLIKVNKNIKNEKFYQELHEDNNLKINELHNKVSAISTQLQLQEKNKEVEEVEEVEEIEPEKTEIKIVKKDKK